jgi:hypothetical protein
MMCEQEIHDICKSFDIKNYTINPDGSIDVEGSVYLFNLNLDKLPLKFNKVGGYFGCSNNNLTTLEGCPTEVGEAFYCSSNKLTSLKGCPKFVGGTFYFGNNPLESLEGSPNYVGGDFYCNNKDGLILKLKRKQKLKLIESL